ncbi:aspartate aminotransferase family protein [Ensifer adhaerens]|jgi:4-aminobutyrate aminotransferase|uniref:aspartate aminotransferase family protein n=1 Tax=Ensifer adhaerens TaxID=106592 RepID=UPI00202F17D0|nr:aspartate aminotransferase family protein [Ensifer adhaerens]
MAQAGSSILVRDARVIADIGRLRFSPLTVKGGKGSYLIEESGREVLDLSGCGGAAILGYSNPTVAEAIGTAAKNMAGASLLLYPNEAAVSLAEKILSLVPGLPDRRVWFGHSGSDAGDCAQRVITAVTKRPRVISFIGSYHGNLTGSMSVSGHTAMTHTLPRPGTVLIPYPDPYRPEFSATEVLNLLEYQFRTTCPPEQVAAVFIEPLLSDGGVVVPPPGFLSALQAICRRHGILIVVDEVKVGLGRTGLINCFEHEGLEPDIVILGKGLGGGVPMSAVIGPRHIMDHATAFAMQTTAGNPVCSAAALATLSVISDLSLDRRAGSLGEHFCHGLRALAEKHEIIGDVRGRGLAIGVDLVRDHQTREPVSVTTTAKIIYRAYELGAAFYYVGLRANVLEFMPPLTIQQEEIEQGLAIIDQAIGDVATGKVSDADVAPYMMW